MIVQLHRLIDLRHYLRGDGSRARGPGGQGAGARGQGRAACLASGAGHHGEEGALGEGGLHCTYPGVEGDHSQPHSHASKADGLSLM